MSDDPAGRAVLPECWRRVAIAAFGLACIEPLALVVAASIPMERPGHASTGALFTLVVTGCAGPIAVLLGLSTVAAAWRTHRSLSRLAPASIVIGMAGTAVVAFFLPAIPLDQPPWGRYCLSNVKQLGMGVMMYSQDSDECLPPRRGWQSGIYTYTRNPSVLRCPDERNQTQPSYAFNARLDLRKTHDIAAPPTVVMVFDSIPGVELNGGMELLPDPARHTAGHTVGMLDGHVKAYSAATVGSLVWRPVTVDQGTRRAAQ